MHVELKDDGAGGYHVWLATEDGMVEMIPSFIVACGRTEIEALDNAIPEIEEGLETVMRLREEAMKRARSTTTEPPDSGSSAV